MQWDLQVQWEATHLTHDSDWLSYDMVMAIWPFNLYHTGIGDLNPMLWGCCLDFKSGVNGLGVCYSDK
jgi:hypothetical protein